MDIPDFGPYHINLGEILNHLSIDNCYSDTTANRLLPFKYVLDYQNYITEPNPRQAFASACRTGCESEKYAYAGIQLTEQKNGLECWCGDTQPLK